MPRNNYRVTIYNQHAQCGIHADGPSRPIAFKRALRKAGEPFLRAGGDKLTKLRVLFHDYLMTHYWSAPHASISDPIGCSVEFRKLGTS